MKSDDEMLTRYAPAERATRDELDCEVQHFLQHPEQFAVLDHVPDAVLILNKYRQVVYANQTLCEIYGFDHVSFAYGRRVGELTGCDHADDMPGGCGTSDHCALCGASQAILASLKGEKAVKECRMALRQSHGAKDLRVYASPFKAMDEDFSLFLIKDIGDEKRRHALEQTFFHDVLNTAAGLQSYSELAAFSDCAELEEMGFRQILLRVTKQLVDEIVLQRVLLHAEDGHLQPRKELIDSKQLLHHVAEIFAQMEISANRQIVVEAADGVGQFFSDRTLIMRVVSNMVKNALEASSVDQTVTLTLDVGETWVEFSVHNESVMPKSVQLQVFNRSFSTKGADRGLGTYSMRLLGEKYLGGKVSFSSNEGEGTTFRIILPLNPDES